MSEQRDVTALLICGHPKSDETSADGYTFCARCAVLPRDTPGPARFLVIARIVVPGDHAMPVEEMEAYIAQALRDGGAHPVYVNLEPLDD